MLKSGTKSRNDKRKYSTLQQSILSRGQPTGKCSRRFHRARFSFDARLFRTADRLSVVKAHFHWRTKVTRSPCRGGIRRAARRPWDSTWLYRARRGRSRWWYTRDETKRGTNARTPRSVQRSSLSRRSGICAPRCSGYCASSPLCMEERDFWKRNSLISLKNKKGIWRRSNTRRITRRCS